MTRLFEVYPQIGLLQSPDPVAREATRVPRLFSALLLLFHVNVRRQIRPMLNWPNEFLGRWQISPPDLLGSLIHRHGLKSAKRGFSNRRPRIRRRTLW